MYKYLYVESKVAGILSEVAIYENKMMCSSSAFYDDLNSRRWLWEKAESCKIAIHKGF